MSEWAPELVVDEARARRLIESQFPELDTARLDLFGQGWDMTVWRVGGEHVFRFPRREVVVPGLLRELQVLPQIAAQLPLRVPEPRFVGRPDGEGDYPWPFYGAPLIPGQEVGQAGLDQAERDALAPALGGFLRELHALPPPDLPHDVNRRADMPFRVERVHETVARLGAAGLWAAPRRVGEILSSALALAPDDERVLTHGDLHLRHLLVDAGRASGIIDWIDVCLAPRGIDLVLYWSLFSAAGRRNFQTAYGDLDEASLLQGRVLALHLCAVLADYAHTTGTRWLEAEAMAGLERAVAD